MKKIIVGFFALAFILTAHSAFAAGWNTDPDDCPLPLSIGNASTGAGIVADGCWTLTQVSANGGQTVSVAVYYDNTSGATQNNVRVILNRLSSGTSSTHTFSGSIVSDQGTFSLGTVSVNLSNPGTLNFSSTKWFTNNQGITPSPLLNGQSGSEVINGGLNIGNIVTTTPTSPTLTGQGSVIVNFTVNSSNNGGTCQDTSANNYGGSLPCTYYTSSNCYINSFTVNNSTDITVQSGDYVRLAWDTDDCTSVNVTGPDGFISSNLNDSRQIYPRNSGTSVYTITAYGNNGGTRTKTVYVRVNDNQYNNCTISNFTANGSTSTTIQSGNPANFVWNTYGCTSVNISGPNLNEYSLSGSRTIYPTVSGTYTLTAYSNSNYNNYNNTQTRTVYVNVNAPIILPPVYNDCAVTTVATNVGQNSATLNGLLTNSTGASYFEYGTTVALGSRTVSRNASGSFTEVISGLTQNTTYYFRFVSQCSGGLSYGKIEFFRTQGVVTPATIVRPIIVQGTTVVGTQSPIMLKIENRYQSIGIGDIVDYTVTYKNIGKSLLTNPVVQVIVPAGITLTNSSAGTYSNETNTLTVPLNDLRPGAEGVIYLQGRVDLITSNTAQIVTTAILVYTSPNGAQENAIAYVLNSPREIINTLGASAFWSGLWNMGIIGWLLLLILILLIILLTRRYYGSKVVHTTTPTGAHTTTTTNY